MTEVRGCDRCGGYLDQRGPQMYGPELIWPCANCGHDNSTNISPEVATEVAARAGERPKKIYSGPALENRRKWGREYTRERRAKQKTQTG